ncbi:Glycosyltransferase involved in cell wall bisynthesis [Pseudobutyrivibrio sp. C4]|uniref:glycosyltransferase family 2 protein n=1 Tax=Pseudobutyrivibrio sp. C4 TaxID=1520803 RepID=UPI0008D6D586|nr:glycosyltransferase family 2 protein [Pseudobutyrivibrio sp. C4]SET12637.1 Glycosyltransferase involved in cell wall bisynthesis [Pseudobutyrivibrio sp. C4]
MISIIIPFYNTEKYIEQCIISIIHQTYEDFEAIFINDGSTDNSVKIVEEYIKKDRRLVLYNSDCKGAGNARNYGISKALGEYIICLDSDDFFEKELLEKMINRIQIDCAEICVCNADRYHQDTGIYENDGYKYLDYEDFSTNKINPVKRRDDVLKIVSMVCWNKLIQRKFLIKNEIKFQDIKVCEDNIYSIKAVVKAETVSLLDEILIHHRVSHGGNLMMSFYDNTKSVIEAIRYVQNEILLTNEAYRWAYAVMRWYTNVIDSFFIEYKKRKDDSFVKTLKNSGILVSLNQNLNMLFDKKNEFYLEDFIDLTLEVERLKKVLDNNNYTNDFDLTLREYEKISYSSLLEEIPFDDSGKTIALFGKGKHTEGLLNIYNELFGNINAKIVYLVSEDKMLGNKKIINIEKIKGRKIDLIVISSFIYRNEMLDELQIIKNEIPVLDIYNKWLKGDLFSKFSK